MTHEESERLFDLRERLDDLAYAVFYVEEISENDLFLAELRHRESRYHGELIKTLYTLMNGCWSLDRRFCDLRRFEPEITEEVEKGIAEIEDQRAGRKPIPAYSVPKLMEGGVGMVRYEEGQR